MNMILVQILAVGLTLSQLFSAPIEQFRTEFNPQRDQTEVSHLMNEGCNLVRKEFGTEKIDIETLLSLMVANFNAAKQKADTTALNPDGSDSAETTPDAPTEKSVTQKILEKLDLPGMLSAYKQFCKNEKVANSSIQLETVINYYNNAMKDLPDHSKLKGMRLPEASTVLDRDGNRFSEVYQDDNRRRWLPLANIPDHLKKAFVAAEDKRFYQHKGLDLSGIVRAFANNVQSKSRPQGGSTITQQVVKNLLVGDNLTFERKMREMVLAVRLEKLLTKDEILELYLNYVFLGRASWGVEMAAQSYFGKSARDLNYAEAAFLAAMTKGPNYYNPDKFPDRALERRQYVLHRMKLDGYLPADQFEPSAKAKLNFVNFESPRAQSGFYFLNEVQNEARKMYDIKSLSASAYTVRSTLNPQLQKTAEVALQDGLVEYENQAGRQTFKGASGNIKDQMDKYSASWKDILPKARSNLWDITWPLAVIVEKPGSGKGAKQWKVGLTDGQVVPLRGVSGRAASALKMYDLIHVEVDEGSKKRGASAILRTQPQVQGAIIVIENATGRILAMSGGFSYAASQLNRVTQSARQPGSTLKPFIYLAALHKGFQPNTLIPDSPVYLKPFERGAKPWSPKNYDGGSRGLVTMRQAIEKSLNLPTARMMIHLGDRTPTEGLDYIRDVTRELGIYDKTYRVYPFILGAQPVRMIDMATAYATIANDGLRPTPHFIDEIIQDGRLVKRFPRYNLQPLPTVDRVSFYQLRRILEGTVERGTAIRLKRHAGYVAGKTGTSNNENDAWFMGFTNRITVGVWVGYDNRNVRASLGGGFTGGRTALPIAEKVIDESFRLFSKEPLPPVPPEIRGEVVEYPIDYRTGRFGGDFTEVFRTEGGRSPVNTWRSVLSEQELSMGFSDLDGRDFDEYGLNDGEGMQPETYGNPGDVYQPGAEDPYDMWQRRGRQVDPFFSQNPFFRF